MPDVSDVIEISVRAVGQCESSLGVRGRSDDVLFVDLK